MCPKANSFPAIPHFDAGLCLVWKAMSWSHWQHTHQASNCLCVNSGEDNRVSLTQVTPEKRNHLPFRLHFPRHTHFSPTWCLDPTCPGVWQGSCPKERGSAGCGVGPATWQGSTTWFSSGHVLPLSKLRPSRRIKELKFWKIRLDQNKVAVVFPGLKGHWKGYWTHFCFM